MAAQRREVVQRRAERRTPTTTLPQGQGATLKCSGSASGTGTSRRTVSASSHLLSCVQGVNVTEKSLGTSDSSWLEGSRGAEPLLCRRQSSTAAQKNHHARSRSRSRGPGCPCSQYWAPRDVAHRFGGAVVPRRYLPQVRQHCRLARLHILSMTCFSSFFPPHILARF